MEKHEQDWSDPQELLRYLMDTYADELKRLAFLYLNDTAECEDIIQEVFISCYQNLSTFRHEARYKTWLIRITINKCKDHQRLWSIRNLIYKPAHQIQKKEEMAEVFPFPERQPFRLIEELAKLSPKYKEVLILFYYQDMTMQEMSDVLGISINTVKSRLLRGKRTLQHHLERRDSDGSVR